MRPVAVFVLMCAAAGAFAQDKPLVELPPPAIEGPDEPAVRIPVQQGDRVEPVRIGGRVVMLKVTPPGGTPYYLVDTAVPRDALDDGTRVPMWAILLFE
jgi:hypothetical protein